MSAKDIAAVLALLVLFGVVGAMDAKDIQAEHAHYCKTIKVYRHECHSPMSGPH